VLLRTRESAQKEDTDFFVKLDRSLCTTLGAAESFSPSHLERPEIKELIDQAKSYYLGGFFLTHGLESALTLAKKAAEQNKVSLHDSTKQFS